MIYGRNFPDLIIRAQFFLSRDNSPPSPPLVRRLDDEKLYMSPKKQKTEYGHVYLFDRHQIDQNGLYRVANTSICFYPHSFDYIILKNKCMYVKMFSPNIKNGNSVMLKICQRNLLVPIFTVKKVGSF